MQECLPAICIRATTCHHVTGRTVLEILWPSLFAFKFVSRYFAVPFMSSGMDLCISMPTFIYIYMQAVGDTGQGWGDAILYILFSREIRKRLFLNPLKQILQKCCSVGKYIRRVNQQRHNIDSERTPIVPQVTRTVTGCPSYTHFTVQHEESDVS